MKGIRSFGTAAVTGASSGIGLEIAKALAPCSKTLILIARRKERMATLAASLEQSHPGLVVRVRPCDLTDATATEELEAELAAEEDLDLLVNNAGFGHLGRFEAIERDAMVRMVELNVLALSSLTRAVLPKMLQRNRGGILNISSGFGFTFLPGLAVYVATKHYVTGLTETIRAETASSEVVITQVCPGPVATEFTDVATAGDGFELPKWAMLTPDKIASASLSGLARNKAVVFPGLVHKLLMAADAITPRPLWRFITGVLSRRMLPG